MCLTREWVLLVNRFNSGPGLPAVLKFRGLVYAASYNNRKVLSSLLHFYR